MRLKKLIPVILLQLFLCVNVNAMLEFHILHPTDSQNKKPVVTQQTVTPQSWFVSRLAGNVVGGVTDYVRKTVNTLRYTAYKLGGSRFDTKKGVYVVDCSTYVDHVLHTASPLAYSKLTLSTRTAKPTTRDYYRFFNALPKINTPHWSKVDEVKQLQPGDILVFRKQVALRTHNRHHKRRMATDGHVMIVMSKPIFERNAFLVRVADSASYRHSNDTRSVNSNGVGIGSLLLKVNPKNGAPNAYAWNIGPYFKSNVKFAMGRPEEEV